jgi:hypothetical protein
MTRFRIVDDHPLFREAPEVAAKVVSGGVFEEWPEINSMGRFAARGAPTRSGKVNRSSQKLDNLKGVDGLLTAVNMPDRLSEGRLR